MPGYDWALLADRGGESIESLIATYLVMEHPSARQVNPGQGDGGIDVILESAEGVEIWQVKKFTSQLTTSQFNQIKRSWIRFWDQHVAHGEATIVRYHLVTPWTPTESRMDDFRELTVDATFPRQWDGEAFINGLADRYQATTQRFIHGPGVFDRYMSERAMLASSPVERGAELSMLEAIEVRQNALDELRATVSDFYRIDHGVRTVTDPGALGFVPASSDPAVFHRMTYLGDDRWSYESVVPISTEAVRQDPISVEVTFTDPPGSPEHSAVVEWMEWGVPPTDVRARTRSSGGPFGVVVHEDSLVSMVPTETGPPVPLYLTVKQPDGRTRLRMRLTVLERTQGMQTGWLRLTAETPNRVIHFELKIKQGLADTTLEMTVGNVDGLVPLDVLTELEQLMAVDPEDTFALELQTGAELLRGAGMTPAPALSEYYAPIARGLVLLQQSTTQPLTMPEVMEVQMGQFDAFKEYVAIYEGTPKIWTWTNLHMHVPEEAEAELFRAQLPDLVNGSMRPIITEQPIFALAGRQYSIERPLVSVSATHQFDPQLVIANLRPGDTIEITPAADDTVTTSALTDWTPGSFPPREPA